MDLKLNEEKRSMIYGNDPAFFPTLGGKEYALSQVMRMSQDKIKQIRAASKEIWKVFQATYQMLEFEKPRKLKRLGFPLDYLNLINCRFPTKDFLARFDLVVTDKDIKLIECNADTPFFEMECYRTNEKVANYFNMSNPNAGMEQDIIDYYKNQVLKASALLAMHPGEMHIEFTCHTDNEEEYKTTLYLKELMRKAGFKSDFTPIGDLLVAEEDIYEDGQVVYEKGLYNADRERIHLLARPGHPIEFMLKDMSTDGSAVGVDLLKFRKENRLYLLNPPSAYMLQLKSVLAYIWTNHVKHKYEPQIDAIIEKYFLPTFMTNKIFRKKHLPYVAKAITGREGESISIYDDHNQLLKKSQANTYKDSDMIYQLYHQLPKTNILTDEGEKQASYIVGCFIVNDEPSAIGVRAGSEITEGDSYWLPLATVR